MEAGNLDFPALPASRVSELGARAPAEEGLTVICRPASTPEELVKLKAALNVVCKWIEELLLEDRKE